MKNKSLVLSVALAALCLIPRAQAQFTLVTNNGAITIAGYTGAGPSAVIPASTNGYPVASIGNNAFKNAQVLSVTIPNSITNIGSSAFMGCGYLTNTIDLPNSVTAIGDSAFLASSIASITIPNSVTSIADNTFLACVSLTNVVIPGSVTQIGNQVFAGCYRLPSLTIPGSVASLGAGVFVSCTNLAGVWFQGTPPSGDGTAFSGLSTAVFYSTNATGWGSTFDGMTTTALPSGFDYALTGKAWTIAGYTGSGSTVIIPASIGGLPVTTIGTNAFMLKNITSVTIPNSVTSLDDLAFDNCTSLTNLVIPGSVTTIGVETFDNCVSLTNVAFSDGIASIGIAAFFYCTALTSVTIPNTVTNLGDSAFAYCSSLATALFQGNAPPDDTTGFAHTSATVDYLNGTAGWTSSFGSRPTAVVVAPDLGYTATNGMIVLTNYTGSGGGLTIPIAVGGLPVAGIGSRAFFDAKITSLTIPASITNLGQYAFLSCGNLRQVYFLGNTLVPTNDLTVLSGDSAMIYYLPGTTGWGSMFDGRPAFLWDPRGTAFSVAGGNFGFTITGPRSTPIAVDACTNLSHPVWLAVSTNTLSGFGASSFSDPQSSNSFRRFYRFRSP